MRRGHAARAALAVLFATFMTAGAAAQAAPGTGALPGSANAAPLKDSTRYEGWEVRYGIAQTPGGLEALAAQAGKPESFAVDVLKSRDEKTGDALVYGTGEAHGLFRVAPDRAAAIVRDIANRKVLSPRLKEIRILNSAPNGRTTVFQDVGITFMGISIGYRLDYEEMNDSLPGGAQGNRTRMTKSHDGKLYAADSTWYLEPVRIGGTDYLYIRTWSASGMRNPAPGVAGVMKLFTSGELKDQVNAVVKLASRAP